MQKPTFLPFDDPLGVPSEQGCDGVPARCNRLLTVLVDSSNCRSFLIATAFVMGSASAATIMFRSSNGVVLLGAPVLSTKKNLLLTI